MMNPTERVFADVARGGAQSVTFAITWPGYGDLLRWERTLGLYGANGLLTRQELAFIVGKHYEEFIGYCQNLPCKEPKWQIGRNSGYNLSRMKLSSLWHLEGEVWQASIRVLSEA
ncbi:hypothetical protein JAAARDRAFT_37418 [Jaapia argillacea MUCL 33604]|uniref:Uncharacterized protein n=1 Tax=Jaapia argillacea MUCL 33604 TaxID=933084 RepID=A0A067PVT3_9AGAM|nr:hypothetical protein JAAARDRAFT_37418 [Jaapia argillacea MUCL 33604]